MLKIFLIAALALYIPYVATYDQSLADCLEVANLFRNTCSDPSSPPSDWSFDSESVTCTSQEKCPDGVSPSSGSCTWERQLCVSCSQSGSDVYINVKSNGLPDHCYGGMAAVVTKEISFKVKFNVLPEGTVTTASSQSDYDTKLCTPEAVADDDLPSIVDFTEDGSSIITTVAGIALNGVAIFNGESAEKVDPFYPQDWDDAGTVQTETVDACVAHPEFTGMFHYHMLPPCLVDTDNFDDSGVCQQYSECVDDVKAYALKAFTSKADSLTVIGLAKDGRVIYGPYQNDGSLIDCGGLDMCNGKWIDGSYSYVWTNTWPYAVACWGPGDNSSYSASCSTNTCVSSSGFTQAVGMVLTGIATLLYLVAF